MACVISTGNETKIFAPANREIKNLVANLKHNVDITKMDKLQILTSKMDSLEDANIRTFNVFFDGLNQMELNPTMQIYHSYYEKMTTKLIPTIFIFTTLLKGVRLSQPSKYKFVQYFLDEIHKYNVKYDAFFINEIILLCAKHPENPTNIFAANNWFNYFMDKLIWKSTTESNQIILNSYMHLFSKLNSMVMVNQIARIANALNLWSSALNTTYRIATEKHLHSK